MEVDEEDNERTPGRGSDQFPLRLPDGMRQRIQKIAKANGRSMNAEIIARLKDSFDNNSGLDELRVRVKKLEKTVREHDAYLRPKKRA
jgi:hypothetical protein